MTCRTRGGEWTPFSGITVLKELRGVGHGVPSFIVANVILLILLRFENDSDAGPKRSQD